MKLLVEKLKNYRLLLTVIILSHIVQAFSLLMLPTYTSSMVDTGIQNYGFEYASPIRVPADSYGLIKLFMTDDQAGVFNEAYRLEDDKFILDEKILKDSDAMEALDQDLTLAMAGYGEYLQMDQAGQDQVLAKLESGQTLAEAMPVMDRYTPDLLAALAKQASIEEYAKAGGSVQDIQRSFLFSTGAKMVGIALLAFLAAATAHFTASQVGTMVGRNLREDLFEKIINFSNQEQAKFSTASLITRTTNDVQQASFTLIMFLRAALMTPITAVGGVVMLIRSQSQMAWIAGSGVLGLFILVGLLFKLVLPAMKRIPAELDQMNLVAREALTGVQVIRAFGRQDFEEERFDQANLKLTKTYLFLDRTMGLLSPAMVFVADIMGVLIVWFAADLMGSGQMMVGQMMSFTAYTMRIFFSFLLVSMMATMLPRSLVSLKRIEEVMETEPSIIDPENPVKIDQPRGLVEFENVSFKFHDADACMLENVNFVAEPGKTTAIIGSTGSGKSTVLNLILRFIDATSGRVLIDGVDVRDMAQKDLRGIIGYVPQKGMLFSGTVASNIGYGVDDLAYEDMEKAAEIAHAKDFVEERDKGYGARIAQEGSNVSGGQKQRLSIARAIAKKPKIFLFDDSFSALDYRTDKSLRAALKENIRDASIIIVAQRISTILDADNIIVLNEGRIDAMGRHEDLMKSSKIYQEIASSQLSKEELEGEVG